MLVDRLMADRSPRRCVLGGLVVALMLDERRRAAARVAVLDAAWPRRPHGRRSRATRRGPELRHADVAASSRADAGASCAAHERARRRADDRGRRARAGATPASMTAPSWTGPALRGAACAVGVAAARCHRRSRLRGDGSQRRGRPPLDRRQRWRSASGAERRRASARADVASRTAQQDGRLTITGLVQNPRERPDRCRTSTRPLRLRRRRPFLASGRAPLDFARSRPATSRRSSSPCR